MISGTNFVIMTNKTTENKTLRLPAEWEPYSAVLIAWPHRNSDWNYMLDDVERTYVDLVKAILQSGLTAVIATPEVDVVRERLIGLPEEKIILFEVATNDTWARDFGVITCEDTDGNPVLCDFKFNGWGLKFASDKDNLITRHMVDKGLLRGRYCNLLGFVLEGGSIESDGRGTILTTSECLLSLNRNGDLTRDEIEQSLCKSLGANRVLWLDHGYLAGDDTDSHIDTLARLAPGDTILYVKCDDPEDEHFSELEAMEKQLMELTTPDGLPYNLVALPMPDAMWDEDGQRLPATYANFLITPRTVLLPVYGQPQKDFLAEQIMRVVFHDREIITVNCSSLVQQHGSLHCVTMQIPNSVLPL